MADNVTADAGSGGAVFATDDISSVHYPRSKVNWGADGTANDVDAASGKGLPVQGEAAHDAATTGNPVLQGAESRTTNPTAVGDGDAVRCMADSLGKQVVILGAPTALQLNGKTTMTDATADDVIAAQGAGVKIAVMGVLVTNGHATVATDVTIRAATTAKITGHAAVNGGGFALSGGGFPLFITGANEAVTAICGTTGSDTDVFVWGYAVTN